MNIMVRKKAVVIPNCVHKFIATIIVKAMIELKLLMHIDLRKRIFNLQ